MTNHTGVVMKWMYVLFALLAGAMMPVQAGINLRLKGSLGDPIWAATASFAVGTLVLLAYAFATKAPIPSIGMAASARYGHGQAAHWARSLYSPSSFWRANWARRP
nr:DMT family transporter [uncultured Pseudodesulfovibrio sp.]